MTTLPLFADEKVIEVFLNHTDKVLESDKNYAQEKGYVFNYYYLDSLKRYETMISQTIGQKFKKILSIAKTNEGFNKLPKAQQEQVLVTLFQDKHGELQHYSKNLLNADDIESIRQSFNIVKMAHDEGITTTDLPAFIINDHVHKRSLSIKKVLEGNDHE